MAVSVNWRSFVGVLLTKAVLFRACIGAPEFLATPIPVFVSGAVGVRDRGSGFRALLPRGSNVVPVWV